VTNDRPDGRIRVLHIITELVVGGAQDNTFLTVEGLDRSRYRVDLMGGAGGSCEARARAAADRLYVLPDLQRSLSVGAHLRAVGQIARILRRERYHVVHTHSANAGLVGRAAAALARVPVVVHTYHTVPGEDLSFPARWRGTFVRLERLATRATDRIVTVCDSNLEKSVELGLAPRRKLETVLSGIDLRRFEPDVDPAETRRALGVPEGWPVVGFVARLAPQNAPDVFVQAARRYLARHPETCFLMAGGGPQLEEIRRMAGDLPQLRVLGSRDDVPRLLRAMDVYVSTAAWAGLGRSVTEAMITGRPVVATAVGGVPEVVRSGETGILVPPGDPEAVCRAVGDLLADPALAARLGRGARAAVVPRFGAGEMVRALDEMYVELLRRRGIAVPAAAAPTPPAHAGAAA
jgi:glycosyltransferase involved in cell wall biosynthesis